MDNLFVRVLNLADRKDRRDECIAEFRDSNLSVSESLFFRSKRTYSDGAIGCALSHAYLLSEYLFESEIDFALVLEDDFQIIDKPQFLNEINAIICSSYDWDVFLLAHNQAVALETTATPNVYRVANSQTASAYLVKRKFAPTLISLFFNAAEHLRQFEHVTGSARQIIHHLFAADMLWKPLQINSRFLARFPAHVRQRPSHSDIQGKLVDYGC